MNRDLFDRIQDAITYEQHHGVGNIPNYSNQQRLVQYEYLIEKAYGLLEEIIELNERE